MSSLNAYRQSLQKPVILFNQLNSADWDATGMKWHWQPCRDGVKQRRLANRRIALRISTELGLWMCKETRREQPLSPGGDISVWPGG